MCIRDSLKSKVVQVSTLLFSLLVLLENEARENQILNKGCLLYTSNTIKLLEDNPYIGTVPRYSVLKRHGYRVLILEKNLAFYKVN